VVLCLLYFPVHLLLLSRPSVLAEVLDHNVARIDRHEPLAETPVLDGKWLPVRHLQGSLIGVHRQLEPEVFVNALGVNGTAHLRLRVLLLTALGPDHLCFNSWIFLG